MLQEIGQPEVDILRRESLVRAGALCEDTGGGRVSCVTVRHMTIPQ